MNEVFEFKTAPEIRAGNKTFDGLDHGSRKEQTRRLGTDRRLVPPEAPLAGEIRQLPGGTVFAAEQVRGIAG